MDAPEPSWPARIRPHRAVLLAHRHVAAETRLGEDRNLPSLTPEAAGGNEPPHSPISRTRDKSTIAARIRSDAPQDAIGVRSQSRPGRTTPAPTSGAGVRHFYLPAMLHRIALFALALAVSACGSTPPDSDRQPPGAERSEDRADDELAMLTERLDLTEAQQASVQASLDALADGYVAARRQPDFRSRTDARLRARVEADAKIAAALNQEQQLEFREVLRERGVPLAPEIQRQLDALDRELDLSDEQRVALGPILTRQTERIDPVMQRARRMGNREEAMAEIRDIRAETDDEILALLTPVQAEGYREIIARRGEPVRAR